MSGKNALKNGQDKPRSSASELASAVLKAVAEMPLDFSDLDAPPTPAHTAEERAAETLARLAEQRAAIAKGKPAEISDHPTHSVVVEELESDAPEESADDSEATASMESRISALFNRVQSLLGDQQRSEKAPFAPKCPDTLEESGLHGEEVERLILKYLLAKGTGSGRNVAAQIKLPFAILDPLLKGMKRDQLLTLAGSAEMGDYVYGITDLGRERARRYMEECTYYGSAPVSLNDYLKAMQAQTIAGQQATQDDLKKAFSDLLINEDMMNRLGPAINSGRGMFLFGEPGNGKTSIAERITQCFGSSIWIPRALGVEGEIIRIFDPGIHEEIETAQSDKLFDLSGIDPRWVQIVRPTVVAGGELTMAQLEITLNPTTKICESPLQLKSNCGTLLIDDFGRQRMPVTELLNRWIVPLEKRYDFLNLPSGKKVQVPFDQLIIFSTNLEPRDLVDGAFLRRIPYKIKVPDPTPDEFKEILRRIAPKMGFQYNAEAVDYLIEKHYLSVKRPFRSCQPRDLLLQVRNYCLYRELTKEMTAAAFDFAVDNYFSVM
ncbi:MAG: AAA family ATPase [Planctomycetaceae bacterium]|nr:AAA family ATPase [Planctomycetaceae bacterium]